MKKMAYTNLITYSFKIIYFYLFKRNCNINNFVDRPTACNITTRQGQVPYFGLLFKTGSQDCLLFLCECINGPTNHVWAYNCVYIQLSGSVIWLFKRDALPQFGKHKRAGHASIISMTCVELEKVCPIHLAKQIAVALVIMINSKLNYCNSFNNTPPPPNRGQ